MDIIAFKLHRLPEQATGTPCRYVPHVIFDELGVPQKVRKSEPYEIIRADEGRRVVVPIFYKPVKNRNKYDRRTCSRPKEVRKAMQRVREAVVAQYPEVLARLAA